MDKILIVGIYLLGISQARGLPRSCDPNDPPANCPVHDPEGPVTFLPHQSDCNKFYECKGGVAYLKKCPEILDFDPVLKTCNWREYAGCECFGITTITEEISEDSTTTQASTPTVPITQAPLTCNPTAGPPVCPEHDPSGQTIYLLPHENDCTKVYKCDWGVPILLRCPRGLHFNPVLKICDWTSMAGCACSGITTTERTEDSTTTQASTTTASTTLGPSTCNLTAWPPSCPEHDSGQIIHLLPHENDCTMVYKCDWGVHYLLSCPDGLHFNPILQVCDWPENAGCACSDITTTTTEITEDSTTTQTATTTPVPSTCNPSAGPPVCPEHDPSGQTIYLLPHENDCTKVYKCDWGVPILLRCPRGLHFNPVLKICDWTSMAGCACSGITTTERTEDSTTTQASTTTASATLGPSTCNLTAWPPSCPEHDSGQIIHLLPHANDCTMVYKCDWGVHYLLSCPGGLHFNPILQVCDWPENAGCACSEITTTEITEDSTTTKTSTQTASTTPVLSTCNPSAGPPICPEHDPSGQTIHLLPHENECTKVYKCDWGVPILLTCPRGLHFNPILKICDWTSMAGCACSGFTTTETTENPTTTQASITTTTTPTARPLNCTDHNSIGPNFILLPHENDCTMVYKCDWEVHYLLSCPGGLHFNPILQVCDWPENAGCGYSEITTTTTDITEDSTITHISTQTASITLAPSTCNPTAGLPACYKHTIHLLPHENDCTKVYKCDWGVYYELSCAKGLHFNPILQICDWPSMAGCACSGITTTKRTEDSTTTQASEQVYRLLPRENDCNMLSKYDWRIGVHYLLSCPGGLHFNPILLVCDWPEYAGCVNSLTPTTPTETPEDSSTT